MLYFEKIDVFEGTDVNKMSASASYSSLLVFLKF